MIGLCFTKTPHVFHRPQYCFQSCKRNGLLYLFYFQVGLVCSSNKTTGGLQTCYLAIESDKVKGKKVTVFLNSIPNSQRIWSQKLQYTLRCRPEVVDSKGKGRRDIRPNFQKLHTKRNFTFCTLDLTLLKGAQSLHRPRETLRVPVG